MGPNLTVFRGVVLLRGSESRHVLAIGARLPPVSGCGRRAGPLSARWISNLGLWGRAYFEP